MRRLLRVACVRVLGQGLRTSGTMQVVDAAFDDPHEEVRATAVWSVGDALSNLSWYQRLRQIQGRRPDLLRNEPLFEGIFHRLEPSFFSLSPRMRRYWLRALGMTRHPAAMRLLRRYVDDPRLDGVVLHTGRVALHWGEAMDRCWEATNPNDFLV